VVRNDASGHAAPTVEVMTELVVATDGSALGNPGPTGWAWYADEANWRSGGAAAGTNNIGELQAIRLALADTGSRPLLVIADSRYAIDCLTRFCFAWERNGWLTAAGKPVANQELIREIRTLMRGRSIRFDWTKGHAGHLLNDRVDSLARDAATRARNGSPGPFGPGLRR
jgi:ribonuclease HI